jgi:hypothetical protein
MGTTKRQAKEIDLNNMKHALYSINNAVLKQREAGKLIESAKHAKIDTNTMFLLAKGLQYINSFQTQVHKVIRGEQIELTPPSEKDKRNLAQIASRRNLKKG